MKFIDNLVDILKDCYQLGPSFKKLEGKQIISLNIQSDNISDPKVIQAKQDHVILEIKDKAPLSLYGTFQCLHPYGSKIIYVVKD